MQRRLLCWALVITFAACSSAHAQGLGSRMGGRGARGGRMGMGRGVTVTEVPAGQGASAPAANAPAAKTGAAVGTATAKPASTRKQPPGAAEGAPADPKAPPAAGEAAPPSEGVVGAEGVPAGPAYLGEEVANGWPTVADGAYPGVAVYNPSLLGRRWQSRGEWEANQRGLAAANINNGTNGPWHAGYYETSWGRPMPVVVPPTAQFQTDWGWGIANTRVTRIWPQFNGQTMGYPYDPAAGVGQAEQWRPTPYWPSDTTQFGIYYIRGPW